MRESARPRSISTGGFKVAPEVLAKYAGTYLRDATLWSRSPAISLLSGTTSIPKTSYSWLIRVTGFQSSVSEVAIAFVRCQGTVTQFTGRARGKDEKCVQERRRSTIANRLATVHGLPNFAASMGTFVLTSVN